MENKNITGKGTFYCVGVGAGEGDYISLGALRAIEKADIIAVPVKGEGEKSTALEIVKHEFDTGKKEILELVFPMTRDKSICADAIEKNTEKILSAVEDNKTVTMITLGDVGIYSTCYYMYEAVKAEGIEAEIVPGIPSFCAAAAKAGINLVSDDESLAILPSPKADRVENALLNFDTVVIMKAGNAISSVYDLLKKHDLHRKAIVCSNIGMDGERISSFEKDAQYGYFTTVIVRKGDRI